MAHTDSGMHNNLTAHLTHLRLHQILQAKVHLRRCTIIAPKLGYSALLRLYCEETTSAQDSCELLACTAPNCVVLSLVSIQRHVHDDEHVAHHAGTCLSTVQAGFQGQATQHVQQPLAYPSSVSPSQCCPHWLMAPATQQSSLLVHTLILLMPTILFSHLMLARASTLPNKL